MAVYQGIVRDSHIELEGGARLAEGTRVEVHTAGNAMAARMTEEELIERLRTEGVVEEAPAAGETNKVFEPVAIQGEPLSAQIIRERR